jgi:hypothetical protein
LNKVRLLLTLVTVGLTLGPLFYEVYVYRDNLAEFVVPAEFSGLLSGDYSNSNVSGVVEDLNKPIQLPVCESSEFDASSGVVRFLFNFTNPFSFNLNLTYMDANVSCTAHSFALGKASLENSILLVSGQSFLLPLKLSLTDQGLAHLQGQHGNEIVVRVDVWGITLGVSGVSLDLPQKYTIDVPIQ